MTFAESLSCLQVSKHTSPSVLAAVFNHETNNTMIVAGTQKRFSELDTCARVINFLICTVNHCLSLQKQRHLIYKIVKCLASCEPLAAVTNCEESGPGEITTHSHAHVHVSSSFFRLAPVFRRRPSLPLFLPPELGFCRRRPSRARPEESTGRRRGEAVSLPVDAVFR